MDLDLLQKKVALHKAVAEESSRGSAVLEEPGWVGTCAGVRAHQLAVVRDQGFGDLWARRDTRHCELQHSQKST